MDTVMVEFRLRELLAERQKDDPSINQSQLAVRAGVSFATVNRLCTNATDRVDLAVLDKLCQALGVTPGDLFLYKRKRGKA
jgi:DNA-binding Xre family transcriptional regulator